MKRRREKEPKNKAAAFEARRNKMAHTEQTMYTENKSTKNSTTWTKTPNVLSRREYVEAANKIEQQAKIAEELLNYLHKEGAEKTARVTSRMLPLSVQVEDMERSNGELIRERTALQEKIATLEKVNCELTNENLIVRSAFESVNDKLTAANHLIEKIQAEALQLNSQLSAMQIELDTMQGISAELDHYKKYVRVESSGDVWYLLSATNQVHTTASEDKRLAEEINQSIRLAEIAEQSEKSSNRRLSTAEVMAYLLLPFLFWALLFFRMSGN